MGGGAVQNINIALASSQTARPIVLLAPTALDAIYAAGIVINSTEETFLRLIPGAMWTDLRSQILAAYANDQKPEISIEPAGAYSLVTRSVDGIVSLTLFGPIP